MSLLISLASISAVPVPDGGTSVALVSGGVLALGVFARLLKNRKK